VEIQVPDYKAPERLEILQKHVLPKALESFGPMLRKRVTLLSDQGLLLVLFDFGDIFLSQDFCSGEIDSREAHRLARTPRHPT
jgi:hypothetical protein